MIYLCVSGLFSLEAIRLQRSSIVRYIPEWFSWLSYKPLARYGHNLGHEVMHGPMTFVRESIVRKDLASECAWGFILA